MNKMAVTSEPIAEAEAYLRDRFASMNEKFFFGRLPGYAICVQEEAVIAPGGRGYHDRRRKKIVVLLMARGEMEGTLLHEMGHAATNGHHGAKWINEMCRVFRLGAPLSGLDLRRLRLRVCDGVPSPIPGDAWES